MRTEKAARRHCEVPRSRDFETFIFVVEELIDGICSSRPLGHLLLVR